MAGKAKKEQEKAIRKEWKAKRKEANRSQSSSGGTQSIKRSGPVNSQWGSSPKTPSTKKLYRGGPNPISKEEYKEVLRKEAAERQKIRDARSPQEQISLLDKYGFTAKKERARLLAIIAGKIKVEKKEVKEKLILTPEVKVVSHGLHDKKLSKKQRRIELEAKIAAFDKRKDTEMASGVKEDYKDFKKRRKQEIEKQEDKKVK